MSIRLFFATFISSFIVIFSLKAQQEDIELYASDTVGVVGNEISIAIKVNNFTDVITYQASINWDATLMAFREVGAFGLPYFDSNDFGTDAADQGHVRFLWEPEDATTRTLADSSVLFSATFEILSDGQSADTITFTDKVSAIPFEIEFTRYIADQYQIANVVTYPGIVALFSSNDDLVNVYSTPNTSCDEKVNNGALAADVNGLTDAYTFQWYAGTEIKDVPDFTGAEYGTIPAGSYTLRILDANQQVFADQISAEVTFEPVATPDVITEIKNQPQQSCSPDEADHTGIIEIEVNDDQPEGVYNITWWRGEELTGEEMANYANSYVAAGLPSGDYEIVVENPGTGCRAYYKSTVTEALVDFEASLSSTKNNYCKDGANGSATAVVQPADGLDLRYFWFEGNDQTDSSAALSKGAKLENVAGGSYKVWIIDLISQCSREAGVAVEDSAIYPQPAIILSNDTVFANYDENVFWLIGENQVSLNREGPFYVPEKSDWYSYRVFNEFNCAAESELINYNITALEDLNPEITIYPNPFDQFVRISNPSGKLDFVRVYDAKGVVIEEIFNVKEKFIDLYLSGSSNGIYLLRIGKDQKITTRKLVQNLKK